MSANNTTATASATAAVSLADQLACAERELALRKRVYPRWVKERRMILEKAEAEIREMAAVVESVRKLKLLEEASREMVGRGLLP